MAIWNCEGKLIAGTGICDGHMAYFESASERQAWFASKSVGEFREYSFTRPDKNSKNAYASGSVHVALPYDSTTEIDYVMYKNNDIDSKRWYYGQVIHREYVNTNSTRLWFETDWYSTFADDMEIGMSYIERSHVPLVDDWDNNNSSYRFIMPEPISLPVIEEPYNWLDEAGFYNSLKPQVYMLFATTDTSGSDTVEVHKHMGVNVAGKIYLATTPTALKDIISQYKSGYWNLIDTSAQANIYAITYVPTAIGTTIDAENPEENTRRAPIPGRGDILRTDGQPIKNAKCFTYPYYFMVAKSGTGEQMTIKFEEFDDGQGFINHKWLCSGGTDPRAIYFPTRGEHTQLRFITIIAYPTVPFGADGYTAWQQQNGAGNLLSGLTAGAQIALGAASIGGATAINPAFGTTMALGGVSQMLSNQGQNVGAQSLPDTLVGASSNTSGAAFGHYKVQHYIMRPGLNDLTGLDDFFEAYGYNISRWDYPDLKVRQNWTYVKTKNAQVKGKCPMEAIQQLQNLLNSGTTFWNAVNCNVGEWRQSNPDA